MIAVAMISPPQEKSQVQLADNRHENPATVTNNITATTVSSVTINNNNSKNDTSGERRFSLTGLDTLLNDLGRAAFQHMRKSSLNSRYGLIRNY
jgi:hypothetical protein